MNFLLSWWIIYLLMLLLVKKHLKLTFYYSASLLVGYAAICIWVYFNLEDIWKHAAHGAPLFMLLYAVYVTSLFFSIIPISIDLISHMVRLKRSKKSITEITKL